MEDARPVSVIVPTRNRAGQLATLLPLLLVQKYPRDAFEILVVDNGSTDHTAQIVEQFANTSPIPVRRILEEQPGVTAARNCGAAEARFPFIAYIDDDCSFDADWLRYLMTGFDLDHTVAAVSGLTLLHWDRGRPSWLGSELEPYLGTTRFLGNQARVLREAERIVEFNIALKHEVWREAGGFWGMEPFTGFYHSAGEGLPLFREMRRRGYQIAFVPQALVYHHVGNRANLRWMFRRLYWQGVADAMQMELDKGFRPVPARLKLAHMRDILMRLGRAALAQFRRDQAKGIFHLCEAVGYLGRLLGELHWVGDWRSLRAVSRSVSEGMRRACTQDSPTDERLSKCDGNRAAG